MIIMKVMRLNIIWYTGLEITHFGGVPKGIYLENCMCLVQGYKSKNHSDLEKNRRHRRKTCIIVRN